MKKYTHLRLALLWQAVLLAPLASSAAGPRQSGAPDDIRRPQFVYDIGFGMNFDNREYGDEAYSPSGTIFGARLAPSVGFVTETYRSRHTLMAGAEFMKDFGDVRADGSALFRNVFFWYGYERAGRDLTFALDAGIFPRSRSKGIWSTAFFSDRYLWYNPYMEGLLMSLDGFLGRIELGCDWIGMHGAADSVKEQFLLFSSGSISPLWHLKLGYDGYMMHLANSAQAPGVADNILLEPYAELELGGLFGIFNEFTLRGGYLQSFQRDREKSSGFETPGLGEFTLRVSKNGFGAANSLYYGKDIMPLYSCRDTAGEVYAGRLYFNDPFFRIRTDGSGKAGSYDRLEVFYSPQLGRSLQLKFSAVFHFNNLSFSGSQQIITLSYSL